MFNRIWFEIILLSHWYFPFKGKDKTAKTVQFLVQKWLRTSEMDHVMLNLIFPFFF